MEVISWTFGEPVETRQVFDFKRQNSRKPIVGELILAADTKKLYVYNGEEYVLISADSGTLDEIARGVETSVSFKTALKKKEYVSPMPELPEMPNIDKMIIP